MVRAIVLGVSLLLIAAGAAAQQSEPSPVAKMLFGTAHSAAPGPAQALGAYSRGCLAGGRALPVDGEGWQVMRLSRNRNWGHPRLLAAIERLASAMRAQGHAGILVGDLAQPRGGPMLTGHASHQIGLDADIWLTPMPDRRLSRDEREAVGAVSMLGDDWRRVDPVRLGRWQRAAIRAAALLPEVERIFVNPAIKQALCTTSDGDRGWLAKVRPWWGHDAHFHIRLGCPADEPQCRPQDPVPPGDGCGEELASWLTDESRIPTAAGPPLPPLRLADLPAACTAVVRAP